MTFSPTGEFFATAAGGEVQVWNRKTGEVEHKLGVAGAVSSLAWSPDGTRLAGGGLTSETGFWRGSVVLWDARTGRVLHDWRTGYAAIGALAWSHDGHLLVTAGGGDFEGRQQRAAARVWTSRGDLVRTLANYSAESASLAISPDSRKIALSFSSDLGGDTCTRVYDLASGKPLAPMQPNRIESPAFDPDGTLLDQRPAPITLPGLKDELVAATSPDRQWMVTTGKGYNDKAPGPAFRLWRRDEKTRGWKQERQVEFNRSLAVSLAASRDALAIGMYGDAVALWDLRSGQVRGVVPNVHYEHSLALSADSSSLAASFLWNVRDAQPERGPRLNGNRAQAFSPDGAYLIDQEGLVEVKTGRRTAMKVVDEENEDHLTGLQSASFSADGQIIATVDNTKSDGQLHLWNGKTGQLLRRVELPFYIRYGSVAFAPQGHVLAAVGSTETQPSKLFLGLLDAKTGQLLRRFPLSAQDAYGIADLKFSPDGLTLVTTGMVFRGYGIPTVQQEKLAIQTNRIKTPERVVRFWDVEKGTVRSSLPASVNYPVPVVFLSNKVCAVVAPSGVEFWSIAQSKLLAQLTILSLRKEKDRPVLEWLVRTPEGSYDTSGEGDSFLRWRVNGKLQTNPPSTTLRKTDLLKNVLAQAR